jgi:hypothetical protein
MCGKVPKMLLRDDWLPASRAAGNVVANLRRNAQHAQHAEHAPQLAQDAG